MWDRVWIYYLDMVLFDTNVFVQQHPRNNFHHFSEPGYYKHVFLS